MSNNDLRSEVSRLRSQLADIQKENARLYDEINQGVKAVNDANQRISTLLDQSVSGLNQSAENLRQAGSYSDNAVQIQMEKVAHHILENEEVAGCVHQESS